MTPRGSGQEQRRAQERPATAHESPVAALLLEEQETVAAAAEAGRCSSDRPPALALALLPLVGAEEVGARGSPPR